MVATLALACSAACSGADHRDLVYGARTARLDASLAVLGWNASVSNLRWQDDYVLVDVDAAPKENDTGLVVKNTSVDPWRADGTQMTRASLGDPAAFTGSGYVLLGLDADTIAAKYRDDSAARGGPMMLLASPTLPAPGLSAARSAYGSSVLILPEASLDAVHVSASLCTQGDISEALLYATVAIVGTHAAVWTTQ